MAAHIYTALQEIAGGTVPMEQLQHAVNYAGWGNQLKAEHYQVMVNVAYNGTVQEAIALANEIMPVYRRDWILLDRPKTYEEWQDRFVNKFLETFDAEWNGAEND